MFSPQSRNWKNVMYFFFPSCSLQKQEGERGAFKCVVCLSFAEAQVLRLNCTSVSAGINVFGCKLLTKLRKRVFISASRMRESNKSVWFHTNTLHYIELVMLDHSIRKATDCRYAS